MPSRRAGALDGCAPPGVTGVTGVPGAILSRPTGTLSPGGVGTMILPVRRRPAVASSPWPGPERTPDVAPDAGKGPGCLVCEGLTVRYRGRREPTIRDVSFVVPEGGLLAVVGPSGSGKSTLCTAILGEVEQVRGAVLLGGVGLLQARSAGRQLVSFVPQRDAVHDELTARRALTLTAALRLAPRMGAAERARRVDEVLELLEIDEQASTRIGHLSGGQRKRVAVAMELLSEPRLLMLDEPTAGLDEGLDRMMMLLLRRVADSGVAVMVVTHATANLELADAVLALDSTGRVAYCGAPDGLLSTFGAYGHAEVMQMLRVARDERPGRPVPTSPPGGLPTRRSLRLGSASGEPRTPATRPLLRPARSAAGTRSAAPQAPRVPVPGRADLGVAHCARVLVVREFRRMAATPFTVARGLLLLPLLTVLLTAWSDDQGLSGWVGAPNRMQGAAMSVLVTCSTFFAMALSFSTVVGDRDVIDRENRWGVPPVAVVVAKALSLAGPVLAQTGVTLVLYLNVRDGPDHVIAGVPVWAVLGASLGLLGLASMCLGLLISAVSRSLERAVSLLMGTTAVLVVLTGLLIPLGHPSGVGGHTLATVSQFAPTRWGTAAVAAYIGHVPIEVVDAGGRTTGDPWWVQDAHHVLTALVSLVVLALSYALTAAHLLARQSRHRR